MSQKLVLVYLFCFVNFVLAQESNCKKLTGKYGSSNNDCCKTDAAEADELLIYSQEKAQDSLTKIHAPFGLPISQNKNIVVLFSPGYIAGYDTVLNIPIWVQYKMWMNSEWDSTLTRQDCFRPDPRLPKKEQILHGDYTKGDFDRGHLKPANDAKSNLTEHHNSFVMTNMAPQYAHMNQKEWMTIEAYLNALSRKDTVVQAYMITGSVVSSRPKLMNESVAIPKWFYKIYFFEGQNGGWQYWVFYVKNDDVKVDIRDFELELASNIKSIDALEKLTKTNFFVAHENQTSIEKKKSAAHIRPTMFSFGYSHHYINKL